MWYMILHIKLGNANDKPQKGINKSKDAYIHIFMKAVLTCFISGRQGTEICKAQWLQSYKSTTNNSTYIC